MTKPPLFYLFDRNPPDDQTCMEEVYRVFERYDIVTPFCRQCFEAEQEFAQVRADRRTAPYQIFRGIYFEHPNCSGGVDTFKYWLPRWQETAFKDFDDYDVGTPSRLARLGVLTWPEDEQVVLRRFFARAAINWIGQGKLEPLGYNPRKSDNFVKSPYEGVDSIGGHIAAILMLLRTDMRDFFEWLLDPSSQNQQQRIWDCVGDALREPIDHYIVHEDGYLVLPEGADEAAYRLALDALQQRSRNDLATLLRPMDLTALALAALEGDSKVAVAIEECEAHLPGEGLQQDAAARAEGEAAIAIACGEAG